MGDVTARIAPVAPSRKHFEADFLVDTGAIDCMAPGSILKRIGVKPEGRDVYELANGQTAEYPVGFVRISFMGAQTVSKIIFGPEDSEPILGVVALESTGIGVDPVSRVLRRMAAKPLKGLGSPDGGSLSPGSLRTSRAAARRR